MGENQRGNLLTPDKERSPAPLLHMQKGGEENTAGTSAKRKTYFGTQTGPEKKKTRNWNFVEGRGDWGVRMHTGNSGG